MSEHSFGVRLRAAMDVHGPLCVGIDPHQALLHAWGLGTDLASVERFSMTAVEAFAGFLVRWPAHPHADNAMYWRAECFLRSGDAPRGVRELQGLLERFPVGNKVPDALFTLRTALLRAGDAAGAERAGQRLLNDHADSEAARRLRDEREGGR
mgnify:CR=1 FL=1